MVTAHRRQHRLGPDQITELVEARKDGAEINDLAKRFGIHRATVINHLNQAGVEGRRRQGRSLSPGEIQAAGELYASGVNLIAVGERFNVDRRYLRKALPQAGFPLRSSGRQPAT